MGHIYTEKGAVPLPPHSFPIKTDGRVAYLLEVAPDKFQQVSIGKAVSPTTMYVNDRFREIFPELWDQYFGKEKRPVRILKGGLYAATLRISLNIKLYPLLLQTFKPVGANALIDHAMFSIREHTSATYLFEDVMRDQLVFSRDRHSDGWYSSFFSSSVNLNDILEFKQQWLEAYAERTDQSDQSKEEGPQEVFLCIDGSNDDCEISDTHLAEPGFNKSHTKKPVVGFIYAVDTDGCPITYDVNRGGMVDSKAVNRIIERLGNSSLKIRCAIMDRGFATNEVLETLHQHHIGYVIMLKSDCTAHQQMMTRYAEVIRWNLNYLISNAGDFGITDHFKVFQDSDHDDCIALLYNGISGPHQALRWLQEVIDCRDELTQKIASGAKNISVPAKYRKYLQLKQTEHGLVAEIDVAEAQKKANAKGYHSLASSEDRTAKETFEIYKTRDPSEKQYATMKSHLGADATNVHSDESIQSKFLVWFIASIIRYEIETIAKRLKVATNVLIEKLDQCTLEMQRNGFYTYINDISDTCKEFFAELGMEKAHFQYLAYELNGRMNNPIFSDERTLPENGEIPKKKPGPKAKPEKPEDPNKPKRGRGRQKGSKNKSTLAREAREAREAKKREEAGLPPIPKRGRGRPKGSLNKSTQRRLEREERERRKANGEVLRRGRPKGSKNKSTLAKEALLQAQKESEVKPEQNAPQEKVSEVQKSAPAEKQEVHTPETRQKSQPGTSAPKSVRKLRAGKTPRTGGSTPKKSLKPKEKS